MADARPIIVVIDGSDTIRTIFKRSVGSLNVRLVTFGSAAQATDFLSETSPDLLFLDIFMPDKEGLTFLEELRADPRHRETTVIVISSKDYAQDRAQAKELGVVDFITKPMPQKAIQGAILRHTGASASA